jgi:uracil-DNA glycosylase
VSRGAADTAARLIPPEADYEDLRNAARTCTACPLYARATQTVFGEGPVPARLMLVGETPGDQEDRQGRPFVGPAGKLLDRCLEAAGIDRNEAYVTNVVKHFKWTERGKRRLHVSRAPARSALASPGTKPRWRW